jgi:hypothetical protein
MCRAKTQPLPDDGHRHIYGRSEPDLRFRGIFRRARGLRSLLSQLTDQGGSTCCTFGSVRSCARFKVGSFLSCWS